MTKPKLLEFDLVEFLFVLRLLTATTSFDRRAFVAG